MYTFECFDHRAIDNNLPSPDAEDNKHANASNHEADLAAQLINEDDREANGHQP
jgi:hypothetical protein